MASLKNLKIKSMQLYFSYKDGVITLEDYQLQIKPLDEEIEFLEIQTLSRYLQGNLVCEKSSLKHLY